MGYGGWTLGEGLAQGPAEEKAASCSHTVLAELWLTHREGRDGAEGAVLGMEASCSQTADREAQATLKEGSPAPQGGGVGFSKHGMSSGGKADLGPPLPPTGREYHYKRK